MPIKKNTNKLSQLYRTIDQKELSKEALDALAKLRLATANFRKQEGKEVDAFKLFFDRLIKNKPTAVKTTSEYKAMIKERRSENGRKAMEARKAKQESRQGQGGEEDSKRPAKPFGWRLKGKHNYRKPTRADISTGKAYYEARINRADTNRSKFPMLERGGMMAKGGLTKDSVKRTLTSDTSQYFLEKDGKDYILFITPKGAMNSTFHDKFKVEDLGNEDGRRKYRLSKETIEFAKGGAIENQYEGREFEDIWNNLTRVQRLHFLIDHEDDLKLRLDGMSLKDYYEKRDAVRKLEFSKLNKKIQDEFIHHVYSGQYADGGYMADGGDVDKGGMIYALREFISSGTIANKTDVIEYTDIAKIRAIAMQYYIDNGDVPYSMGELDRIMAYANDKLKSGIMAKGGQIKYSTYDNKSMDYIEGEIAHTERSAREFQQKGDYETMEDRKEHVKMLREIYNKKRAESKMAKGGVFYTDSHKQGH